MRAIKHKGDAVCYFNLLKKLGVVPYHNIESRYLTQWLDSHPYIRVYIADGKLKALYAIKPLAQDVVFDTLDELIEWVVEWAKITSLRQRVDIDYPKPTKYKLKYRKESGEIKGYTVSNPIEANKESITVYAFRTDTTKAGVRTFKKDRIISFAAA